MKQQIEIDVPDGFEVDLVQHFGGTYTKDEKEILKYIAGEIRYFLKKKQPEFIEVRDFLLKYTDGRLYHASIQKDMGDTVINAESHPLFHKWIDQDWRKVEI